MLNRRAHFSARISQLTHLMSFTITWAAFCHPRLLCGFHQRRSTATSEDRVGRIISPFLSLVLRFLPFTHLPFTQQFPCIDEVGPPAFVGMRFPLISCVLFLSALWSCRWSASSSPALPWPNSTLHQQQECFLVFLRASTTHLLHQPQLLPSPGDRPAHLPPPLRPFYGWKGLPP